jgi:hypothetical protein
MFANQAATGVVRNAVVSADGPAPVGGNVETQLKHAESLISGAHTQLDRLIARLSPVARPLPPSGGPTGAGGNQAIASPLSEVLRGQNIALEALVDKINATLDALDL